MPGAGKTTVGRLFARRMGKDFHDTDHEIEQRTGVSIAVIFEIEGEPGFRRRESETLEQLTRFDDIVLATGGGAILDEQNRHYLKDRGFVIYLHAPPRELWRRTRRDKTRPLLQGDDPQSHLEALYKMRDPLYRNTADLVIESGRQSAGTLIIELLIQVERACGLSASH